MYKQKFEIYVFIYLEIFKKWIDFVALKHKTNSPKFNTVM